MSQFPVVRITLRLFCLFAACFGSAYGQLGNVWHIPGLTQNGVPTTMRDSVNPVGSATVTFYQGVWKGDGANQTGDSLLYYRIGGGSWQTTALGFHSNVDEGTDSHNQFWKTTVAMPESAGTLVEYFFAVTFDNRTSPTYLYGNNQTTDTKATAQASPTSFTVAYPPPTLTVNGVNSDYSKSNFYIDEINGGSVPELHILFSPNVANLVDVEIYSNVNQRDFADDDWDNDGVEDGIIPPDGNAVTSSDTTAYFRAYEMMDAGGGSYTLTLPIQKTGAYRLTGRYKVQGNPDWIWIGDSGVRDHAIIVAPTIARDMSMYELHVTNANATGPTFAQRGTFEDLHDGNARVNLTWLRELGVNWIWFQPFQAQGLEGRQTDPDTGLDYDPGSPYAIRNFWEINPLYSDQYNGALTDPVSNPDNYAVAMTAFQAFATAADAQKVQLMLDFPFNHTAPDVVLGAKGVELFGGVGNPGSWQASDKIRDRVAGFFSTAGANGAAYSNPAANSGDIAVAPDRDDFGKWNDVRDVFFGRYATLVTGNPGADSSRATVRNEGDWFDYSSLGPETQNTWRYFGEVLKYWIVQSGHRGYNSTSGDGDAATRLAFDQQGIDGLRKDFGQGLPPQCMEYIINVTHSVKWNFVFMTESLDGGEVTYRSSRHFTVLNENIVFPLQAATTTSGYRSVFENRSNSYGESLVLLNNTSHDEVPYADPWEALIRYATVSTNEGTPMIMYGQEIGASIRSQESPLPQGSWDWYELNFGKYIPHFKKWNSLQPQWTAWDNNDLGVQFLRPVYAGIGQAREFSPALRSRNRWFLNRHADDQVNQSIFAVAKYTDGNTSPAFQDVVLAFSNLDRDNVQADTFGVSSTLADILGLEDGRTYNVKNIAAYLGRNQEHAGRRDSWLWGAGMTRSQIVNNGIFVSLNPVPADNATWETAPYEAQFLKMYDVTAPPVPASVTGSAWNVGRILPLTIDTSPFGSDDNIVSYQVRFLDAADQELQSTIVPGLDALSLSVNSSWYGQTITVEVTPVSSAGVAATGSVVSSDIVLLDPTGDADGDHQSNENEDKSGTNPLDQSSVFQVVNPVMSGDDVSFTVKVVHGYQYTVKSKTDLTTPSWLNEDEPNAVNYKPTLSETEYTFTDLAPVTLPKFYRVLVTPTP